MRVLWIIKRIFKLLYYKIIYGKKLKIGKRIRFRDRFRVNIEKPGKVIIGSNCFFNNDCSINCLEQISIGNDCIFGENVKIYDHNHKFSDSTTIIQKQGFSTKPISIGSNCWISSNVTILKGVTIGNNCVIGAGCIVKEDVLDNCILKRNDTLIIEKIKQK